ncbi:MAG: NAD(P)H-hydrate dehydratase [Bacillota bacterium]|nr:NAD(P)H-hydrate dehydratase [Bacillota bacterium]
MAVEISGEPQLWDSTALFLGQDLKVLMEGAGSALAHHLRTHYPDHLVRGLLVVAGLGGNGGDGAVAARHLAHLFPVEIWLLGKPSQATHGAALENFRLAASSPWIRVMEVTSEEELRELAFPEGGLILDAILGRGQKGPARGLPRAAIQRLAALHADVPIVSVDVPSGYPFEPHVRPREVVAFQWDAGDGHPFPKVLYPIGFLPETRHLVGPGHVRPLLGRPGAHKGQNGDLLVLGGSEAYPGAPLLSALAAAPFVDRVWLGRPQGGPLPPQLIPMPLGVPAAIWEERHLPEVEEVLDRVTAVVVGPGMGRHPTTLGFLQRFLKKIEGRGLPMVVDADALEAMEPSDFRPWLLTPHAGEARRLWERVFSSPYPAKEGLTVNEELFLRREALRRLSLHLGVTLLGKGPLDVAVQEEKWLYNITGNRGLTAGGTGDVLAGLAGAFLAQGQDPLLAGAGAAFLVGLAGEALWETQGFSFTASDVAALLPQVAGRLLQGENFPRR